MNEKRDLITRKDELPEFYMIPSSQRKIDDFAYFCSAITTLYLNDTNITIIGKYAFDNCQYLEKISFPSSLEEICEGAFMFCSRLENIIFPSDSKLKIIGPSAFFRCCNIQRFEFPPSIESIGEYAFCYCIEFPCIDLSKTKVQFIGKRAFELILDSTILLPPTVSVSNIIRNYFSKLVIDENHLKIKRDECGYHIMKNTIFHCFKHGKHVIIRQNAEIISSHCFYSAKIVSITIPSSIIVIEKYAFAYCKSLQWVRFQKDSQIKEINKGAFFFCKSLRRFKIPQSLKSIPKKVFDHCTSLEKVVLRLKKLYFLLIHSLKK